ncbi:MAG: hypothetical protein EON58_22225 [Alphaproteobacteria bacterium]|nr:MAG: hypothetical protein EON58_22225 [Alphaproteobacteria bacterium]
METVAEQPVPETAPRPNIELTDALSLIPRLFAGFLLGGLAVLHIFTRQWGMVAFLSIASGVLLYWGYRLMMKMRSENVEYIAYRAAQEAEERARKAAHR